MKIICLIRPRPHTVYFTNAIHASKGVSLVIVESREPVAPGTGHLSFLENLRKRVEHDGFMGTLREHLLYRWRQWQIGGEEKRAHAHRDACLTRFFGNKYRSLHSDIPVLQVANINDDLVRDRLSREHPDIVLDHGTSIVRDTTLSPAPLTLNLHWGLSPWYRGALCTKFALLQRDPLNIGVTIHALTKNVDGGDVVGQERAMLSADDTAESINMQLTRRGTDIVLEALALLERGEKLPFHAQDLSQGLVTTASEWGPNQEEALQRLYAVGGIADMLQHPNRAALPIIPWQHSSSMS